MGDMADDYDWGDLYDGDEEREVRCKFCRKRDLFWQEGRGEHNRKKWVLVDEYGDIHDCRKPVKLSDFPVVEP